MIKSVIFLRLILLFLIIQSITSRKAHYTASFEGKCPRLDAYYLAQFINSDFCRARFVTNNNC